MKLLQGFNELQNKTKSNQNILEHDDHKSDEAIDATIGDEGTID